MIDTINLFSDFTGIVAKSTGVLEGLSANLAADAAAQKEAMAGAFDKFMTGQNADKASRFFDDVDNAAKRAQQLATNFAGAAASASTTGADMGAAAAQTAMSAFEGAKATAELATTNLTDAAEDLTSVKAPDSGQFKNFNLKLVDVKGLANLNDTNDPQLRKMDMQTALLGRIVTNTADGGLA
jgi:hypothetical protein